MVLRLDKRYAIVWRDPFSLQIGVDPARAVLRDVTTADERMIAALIGGVSRSGLDMIAESSEATERDVSTLLRAVGPSLVDSGSPQRPRRVGIAGTGQTVDRIATMLATAGVDVIAAAEPTDEAVDLGIAVGHYVLDPRSYGHWLRRDLPHLPVTFGDETVTMGPLVEPGITACLYCLEHHRRDDDPSWAAIASQLWGRSSQSETTLVSSEVSARVTRMVLARLSGGRIRGRVAAARSFRLAVDSGEVTRRDWMPHPNCGCVAISAGLSETDSVPAVELPVQINLPTTVEVSAWPA